MGKLDAEKRKDLPKKDFALPKTRSDTGGEGGYPIEDEAHARAALARVAANGTPEEQETVRKKVHAKYPDMEMEGSSEDKEEPKKKLPFHEWVKQPARMKK